MSEADRRIQQRVAANIGTIYHDQLEVDGTDALMSDLSLGGACILTNRPSPPGTEIDVQLRLSATDPIYRAKAVVRWVRESEPGIALGELTGAMGVQFTEISEAALTRLKIFIEEKASAELFA
jgi:hypothetical protein